MFFALRCAEVFFKARFNPYNVPYCDFTVFKFTLQEHSLLLATCRWHPLPPRGYCWINLDLILYLMWKNRSNSSFFCSFNWKGHLNCASRALWRTYISVKVDLFLIIIGKTEIQCHSWGVFSNNPLCFVVNCSFYSLL